jgi:hypothetical protein
MKGPSTVKAISLIVLGAFLSFCIAIYAFKEKDRTALYALFPVLGMMVFGIVKLARS